MSLFTTEDQRSVYYKDPDYYRGGSDFLLGLMGYKRNGQESTFGKIKDVALPIVGGIAGTLIGGPVGASIGASLGQAANAASNRVAAGIVGGHEDSENAVNEDLSSSLTRGNLGLGLSSLASSATQGVQQGQDISKILKNLGPVLQQSLPDIAGGTAGAIGSWNSQPAPKPKNVYYFAAGGEVQPRKASPEFAAKFREERDKQGAGGTFTFKGKSYTTNFREEEQPQAVTYERTMPGIQPNEYPTIGLEGLKKKAGIDLDNMHPVFGRYLATIPDYLRKGVVLTSGRDSLGIHASHSKHRTGNALDMRFNPALYNYIKSDPLAYQLGLETIDPYHGTAPHIHLQYNDGPAFALGGLATPTPPNRRKTPGAYIPPMVAAFSTATAKPYNPLLIPKTLPEATVTAKRNPNPLSAAGAQIGEEYVEKLKANPRYKTSPWSVGSPADIVDPLVSYPGKVLDQATKTNQNAVIKPSTIIDATTAADLKVPIASAAVGIGLVKKAVPVIKQIGRNIADPALEAGLRSSRELGAKEGWSAEQIAKHQFDNYGITNNQRKAYVPVVSDILAKHIRPFNYNGRDNFKRAADIAEERASGMFKDRYNAWDMYLGFPQKTYKGDGNEIKKTFSYLGQENGEDVLRLDNYQPPYSLNVVQANKIKSGTPAVAQESGGIMGNYGIHPMGDNKLQYRDRWDLDFPVNVQKVEQNLPFTKPILNRIDEKFPDLLYKRDEFLGNKPRTFNIRLEKLIGKPFHSRGNLTFDPASRYATISRDYAQGGETSNPAMNNTTDQNDLFPSLALLKKETVNQKPVIQAQGIAYRYGGITGKVKLPGTYNVYAPDDQSEDLLMIDKKTGQTYGHMRYGEYIVPQNKTLAAGHIMQLPISDTQKKLALGDLLHKQLTQHPITSGSEHAFALGGITDPPEYKANSLDAAFNMARAARTPRFLYNGRIYDAKDLDPMAGAWARPVASPPRPTVTQQLNQYQNSDYYKSKMGIPLTSTTPPTTTPKTPLTTTHKPSTNASPNKAATSATTTPGTQPVTVADMTVSQRLTAAKKLTYDTLKQTFPGGAGLLPPVEPEAIGKVPVVPDTISTKPGISTRALEKATGFTPTTAVNYQPEPVDDSQPATAPKFNLGQNLMDIGRVVAGAAMAAKKTPTYQVPARFTNWQSQVEQKANQGLSSQELSAINGQIADNYSSGVTALANSGAGNNVGATLAGLTRLNQQRAQQTQAATNADILARRQNFAAYGQMVNQDLGLNRQAYEDNLARVQSGQQGGIQLTQAGLQGIGQRSIYDQMYGEGSLYSRIMGKQLERESETTKFLKKMRSMNASAIGGPFNPTITE